jgi:hypothetical protein
MDSLKAATTVAEISKNNRQLSLIIEATLAASKATAIRFQ